MHGAVCLWGCRYCQCAKLPAFKHTECSYLVSSSLGNLDYLGHSLDGMLMRKPSELGSRVMPWPMMALGGNCSMVCSVRPMS